MHGKNWVCQKRRIPQSPPPPEPPAPSLGPAISTSMALLWLLGEKRGSSCPVWDLQMKGNALGLLFFFCLRKMQAAALHVFCCITSQFSYSSNQRPWQERGFSTRAVFELELL